MLLLINNKVTEKLDWNIFSLTDLYAQIFFDLAFIF